MRLSPLPRRAVWCVVCALVLPVFPVRAADTVLEAEVLSVEGRVLARADGTSPFVPASAGMKLRGGGAVVVLQGAKALLRVAGSGRMTLADNAAFELGARSGEFSAVTGVRAPVLFLYPKGDCRASADSLASLRVVFGIDHGLPSVSGVERFALYAVEVGAADDAEPVLLSEFRKSPSPCSSGYTWYEVAPDAEALEELHEGEYTLVVAAVTPEGETELESTALLTVVGGK